MNKDLFGNPIETNPLLRDKFIEPPFSVLDTKSGNWQRRKKLWKAIGIKSEVGRDATTFNMADWNEKVGNSKLPPDTSIFDPALCEVMYHWYVPKGGKIIDPFAGGSVRGIVAHYLGYKYSGIDIRQEQVESNREQALDILDVKNQPQWYVGDSMDILDRLPFDSFDFAFTCPPYFNLEVYSDMPCDLSNMSWERFKVTYRAIIQKTANLLKHGGYACFVVGEVRDKNGNYIGLVPETIEAFKRAGMGFYNEAVLLTSIASASMRAAGNMKSKKLVKVHQNVLIFKK